MGEWEQESLSTSFPSYVTFLGGRVAVAGASGLCHTGTDSIISKSKLENAPPSLSMTRLPDFDITLLPPQQSGTTALDFKFNHNYYNW